MRLQGSSAERLLQNLSHGLSAFLVAGAAVAFSVVAEAADADGAALALLQTAWSLAAKYELFISDLYASNTGALDGPPSSTAGVAENSPPCRHVALPISLLLPPSPAVSK